MADKKKLTEKQKRFCKEYIKDLNGSAAAVRAGYSSKASKEIACDLLTKTHIKNYISELQKPISEKLNISATEVLEELKKIAFSDMADFVTIEEGGKVTPLMIDQLKSGASRIIKRIREKRVIRQTKDDKDDMVLDDTFEFELHDKLKALELLGRHLALFTDNVKTTEEVRIRIDV